MSNTARASLSRRSFFSLAAWGALAAAPLALGTSRHALANEAQTVTITSLNAAKEPFELAVPFNPQRVAVLDMASLDIIDRLGMGARVVGMADTSLEYLQEYANNADIARLGTIKEADLESTMACEPDVIFIGGRLAASYDDLSRIAPVVYLAVDTDLGLLESVRANATAIARIFGLEGDIAAQLSAFDERLDAIRAFSANKTAAVGLCTSGSFNILGDDGRCSLIGREAGFSNVAAADGHASDQGSGEKNSAAVTSTHGNESSFETLVKLDPDYIFVLDRDAAIGAQGTQLAREIMENELVKSMRAFKDGHVVYLSHPSVWYTAEGGIAAFDQMLADLEAGLDIKKPQ